MTFFLATLSSRVICQTYLGEPRINSTNMGVMMFCSLLRITQACLKGSFLSFVLVHLSENGIFLDALEGECVSVFIRMYDHGS